MRKNKSEFIISALLLVIFAAVEVNAGGPLFMWNAEQRIPYRWDVTSPVKIYTDIGPFEILPPNPPVGTILVPNEKADEIVAFAAKQWTDVGTSSFQAEVVGDFASIGLPDVKDAATAALVFAADNGGGIHIVYDADGKVLRDFFGAPTSVLGIASPEWADEATGTITEGWVIINAQRRWFNDNDLLMYAGVFTHEFGHAINLAHSQTNGAIAFRGDARGPANCTTLPYPTALTVNEIETMYPFIDQRTGTGTGIAQSTVDLTEDKAAISNLYPEAGYPNSHGSISGRILQTNGKDGITGINVIARNLDNPFADAASAMSGDYVRVAAGDDGTFTLNGLTPGGRYALYTDKIVAGGFPTTGPYYISSPEEFYNGANESGNGLADDRCSAEPITAVAGSATDADIILNSVKGAPQFIPLAPGTGATSVTGDGSVVAGGFTSGSTGGVFRWTEESGYEVLSDFLPTAPFMSRDGNAFAAETAGPNGKVASLLHYGGSWQQLPLPEAIAPEVTMLGCFGTSSVSFGVAANGSAVSGMVNVDANGSLPGLTCRVRPFIWTPEVGSKILPIPAAARTGRPNNISQDASTVVGWYEITGFRMGASWVNGSLYDFSTPALIVGEAFGTTPDGSTIVGFNAGPANNFNNQPWRWTRDGGLQLLDKVAPNGVAGGSAISDNGLVIAGIGGSTSPFPGDLGGRKLFLWTPELGAVDFVQFIQLQGTYLDGWILTTVPAMSSDGTTLVGGAVSPAGQTGWVVRMTKVNICHAPPGNPGSAQTINVPFVDTLGDHLKHGDTIGVCTDSE